MVSCLVRSKCRLFLTRYGSDWAFPVPHELQINFKSHLAHERLKSRLTSRIKESKILNWGKAWGELGGSDGDGACISGSSFP